MNAWVAVLIMLGPIFVIMAVLRNQKRISKLRSATVELRVDDFGVRRVLELEQTFLYLCLHDGGLLDMQVLCKNLEVKKRKLLSSVTPCESI